MRPEDVATICDVHEKTVYRAIKAGKLRAAQLGARGTIRITPEDIDNWVSGSVVKPSEAALAEVVDITSRRKKAAPKDGRLRVSGDRR
ncbi:MAG: helix-turn-helix domain-containing protein [Dehalococcoidia bacterium]